MLLTSYDNKFEAPSEFDPANYALQMQRVAEQIETEFNTLQPWLDFFAGNSDSEVGSPVIIRERTSSQVGFTPGNEKAVLWNNTVYDNTGSTFPAGDQTLLIPEQDQRYWWYMGVNILIQAIDANARYTTRLYVQDFDPVTGQVLQTVQRHNQYMSATSNQFMVFDGLFRTGGGNMYVSMNFSAGNPLGIDVLASSSVWAVRLCPAR
jgi:hypothetical protein